MTATPILERLAREFKTSQEHVSNALEMLDAGLSAPFIGRFRRARAGSLSESVIRRLQRRREELEDLDRRRGTILRLLEREERVDDAVMQSIAACMDRFDLEDLFLPHRRPEPEVQLALDRGLGALADLLVHPLPKEERGPDAAADESAGEEDDDDDGRSEAHSEHARDEAPADELAGDVHEQAAAFEAEQASAPQAVEQHETSTSNGDDATAPDESSAAEESSAPDESEASERHEGAAARSAPREEHTFAHREVLTPELARLCAPFVSPDKGIHNETEALAGAVRILSDRLGRNTRLRGALRRMMRKQGVLSVRATVDDGKAGRYRSLLKTNQPMRQMQGHRLLAIRQAQKERVLATRITIDERQAMGKVRSALGKHLNPAYAGVLDEVCYRALHYRLLPMIEEDVRLELKERADSEALRYLSQHLRQLLLSPPLARALPVAGIDVNAKGDWTVALVDADGTPVAEEVRIETGEKDAAALGAELATLLAAGPGRPEGVEVLAVSNSKGSRTAAPRIRAALRAAGLGAHLFIVTEAGLSSYANSDIARRELESSSVPMRMAISIARRLQNPIAELLKVDPRHLSLGSEQGLVSKANVRRAFKETVESCTAHVGCDVNRATAHFLAHLPGLDRSAADRIVARRAERRIESREELRDEGILDEAQWTSAVAFLRVPGSTDPLDRTGLHPEQYSYARRILESVAGSVAEGLGRMGITKGLRHEDYEVDEDTWRDLTRELAFPGRDPRLRVYRPQLLEPTTDPATVEKGSVVEGIISNVASFGAFVDVGLPQDAMVHISEISERYVRDARELLSVGQIVRARVVDSNGQRLTLSLKNVPREQREPREQRDRRPRAGAGGGGGTGGGGGGNRRGGERPRRERQPATNPNLRAAQTRRDGLGTASSGNRRGGFGGAGAGGRGARRGPHEADERVDLKKVNQTAGQPLNNPFANFFKGSRKEGEREEEPAT